MTKAPPVLVTEVPSPFCESVPTLYRAWDNTLLKTVKECGYKHMLHHVLQWQAKNQHPRLTFGILFHKGEEYYEHAKAEGLTNHQAQERAIVQVIAEAQRVKYVPDKNVRSVENLIRAIVWYSEYHGDPDPAETVILSNGKPAVELSFAVELPITCPDGTPYLYCGHIDRLVRFIGKLYVTDYKTTEGQLTSKYFQQFSPNGQMSGYTYGGNMGLAEEIEGCMVDAVQLAVNFSRFQRHLVPRTKSQLEEWLRNTCKWIKFAEQQALEGDWLMNEESCHHWSGCAFEKICSKDESIRHRFLASDFYKSVWNPLEAR